MAPPTSGAAHQAIIVAWRWLRVCDGGHWLDVMKNRGALTRFCRGKRDKDGQPIDLRFTERAGQPPSPGSPYMFFHTPMLVNADRSGSYFLPKYCVDSCSNSRAHSAFLFTDR
jgi:hypothetical protein